METRLNWFLVFMVFVAVYVLNSPAAAQKDSAEYEGKFVKAECECECKGQKIESVGMYKPSPLDKVLTDEMATAKQKCQEQCARTCGGFTDCPEGSDKCEDCCKNYCKDSWKMGGSSSDGKEDARLGCEKACNSACEFRYTVNGIVDVIYTVAAVVGGLMLIVHAIRLITSGDASARDAAKTSMLYVIIALIIIAVAGAAVKMFTGIGPRIYPTV